MEPVVGNKETEKILREILLELRLIRINTDSRFGTYAFLIAFLIATFSSGAAVISVVIQASEMENRFLGYFFLALVVIGVLGFVYMARDIIKRWEKHFEKKVNPTFGGLE